jgi:ankyrin repeat protein
MRNTAFETAIASLPANRQAVMRIIAIYAPTIASTTTPPLGFATLKQYFESLGHPVEAILFALRTKSASLLSDLIKSDVVLKKLATDADARSEIATFIKNNAALVIDTFLQACQHKQVAAWEFLLSFRPPRFNRVVFDSLDEMLGEGDRGDIFFVAHDFLTAKAMPSFGYVKTIKCDNSIDDDNEAKKYDLKNGMCMGIGRMATQAFLCRDIGTFLARLLKLKQIDFSKSDWASVLDKPTKAHMLAFFDGVLLFQRVDLFHDLLGPLHEQTTSLTAKARSEILSLMSPLALKNPIEMIAAFSGAYTKTELGHYFKALENLRKALTFPLSLTFHGSRHGITLGYVPGQQAWYLVDANQLPCFLISSEADFIEKVAGGINKFRRDDPFLIAGVECYVTSENKRQAQDLIEQHLVRDPQWVLMHRVTTDKATTCNSYKESWLFLAVAHSGNDKLVSELLCMGANPYASTDYDASILGFQVGYCGTLNYIPLLLTGAKSVADSAEKTLQLSRALYLAIDFKYEKVADFLLEKGADVNHALTVGGRTTVGIALIRKQPEMVLLLLQRGARLTPLEWRLMILRGYEDSVLEALRKGIVDPSQDFGEDETPLSIARMGNQGLGFSNIYLNLLQHSKTVDAKESALGLLWAASDGHLACARELCEQKGVLIGDVVDTHGNTPLMLAIHFGRHVLVQYLVDQGADIFKVGANKISAMMISCGQGNASADIQHNIDVILLRRATTIFLEHVRALLSEDSKSNHNITIFPTDQKSLREEYGCKVLTILADKKTSELEKCHEISRLLCSHYNDGPNAGKAVLKSLAEKGLSDQAILSVYGKCEKNVKLESFSVLKP